MRFYKDMTKWHQQQNILAAGKNYTRQRGTDKSNKACFARAISMPHEKQQYWNWSRFKHKSMTWMKSRSIFCEKEQHRSPFFSPYKIRLNSVCTRECCSCTFSIWLKQSWSILNLFLVSLLFAPMWMCGVEWTVRNFMLSNSLNFRNSGYVCVLLFFCFSGIFRICSHKQIESAQSKATTEKSFYFETLWPLSLIIIWTKITHSAELKHEKTRKEHTDCSNKELMRFSTEASLSRDHFLCVCVLFVVHNGGCFWSEQ